MVWGHGGDTTQIHSCVTKDGTIRIVGATAGCKAQETALDWNIVGPAGPTGPTGATGAAGQNGAPGDPGPRGPSDGYAADAGLNPFYFDSAHEIDAAQLVLNPGAYVVNAKVTVANVSGDPGDMVTCSLRHGLTGNLVADLAETRLIPGAPFATGSFAVLPLTGSVDLPSTEAVKLHCLTTVTSSNGAFVQFAKLNAVKVETLTPQ
jgi:hypothetical protein